MSKNRFYKNATTENSVAVVRTLFENLSLTSDVYAEYELESEGMITLHNHMNSSSTWDSVTQWDSGVQYSVNHPNGEISLSDKNRGLDTRIFRERQVGKMNGMTSRGDVRFTIYRKEIEPLDFSTTSCHSSMYTWVKIESKKTYSYVSGNSSWDFALSVLWEGKTKEEAEASEKRYVITISMGSIEKAKRDTGYTAASFMEKLMDTLFQRSQDRHIVFLDH